jgi:hypothetical protein
MSQNWNQPPQNPPPSGFGQPQGGGAPAPFGGAPPGPGGGFGPPPGGAPGGGFGAPPGGGGGFGPPPGGGPAGGPPPGGFGAPPGGGPPGGVPQGPMGGGPMGGGENNMALVSLISGGVSAGSLLCCCIPFVGYLSWLVVPLAGITAIITGILGLKEANETGVRKNEAIAGIALGSIGIVLIVVGILVTVFAGVGFGMLGAMQPH